jgi:CheY-like chemotaxis protein
LLLLVGQLNEFAARSVDLFRPSLGVLEHIAKYERPPQRVILTNYATRDMHHRCRELGADAVFDKSTEIDELIEWLAGARVRH